MLGPSAHVLAIRGRLLSGSPAMDLKGIDDLIDSIDGDALDAVAMERAEHVLTRILPDLVANMANRPFWVLAEELADRHKERRSSYLDHFRTLNVSRTKKLVELFRSDEPIERRPAYLEYGTRFPAVFDRPPAATLIPLPLDTEP
jgi:hypothetical protein